jgi:hypothetical protein
MQAQAAQLKVPDGVDPLCAAVVTWVFGHIKKANGLGIFAHPFWFNDVQNVPDAMIDYIIENNLMDALEVIGGEHYYEDRYYEQNRLQVIRYNDDRARGYRYPIVGSSDSHDCYATNPDAFISSTMVFSPLNERRALIDAIKGFYSIAIDTFSKEYRMVGGMRLVRYGSFLLKYYFPLHDELCFEEGRLMKQYATGTADEKKGALDNLECIYGRMKKLQQKYFSF